MLPASRDAVDSSKRGTLVAPIEWMQVHSPAGPAKSIAEPNYQGHQSSPALSTPSDASTYSQYIVDEINTYIAIRDLRVAEAERSPTIENLRQAELTNNFVETCLQRPQVVYAAQHLPEVQADFERKRCAVVKTRLTDLRGKVAA